MTTQRTVSLILSAAILALLAPARADAHCQVPCGIYDDHNRVHRMKEDLSTIAKAIKRISNLADKADPQSKNQLARWVLTKEQHADKIIRVISDYFMAQKIKPAKGKREKKAYQAKLARHHRVIVAAMKCKQSVDPKVVTRLAEAIRGIEKDWPRK